MENPSGVCVFVCVRVCVCACVRVCVCVRACVRACVRVHVYIYVTLIDCMVYSAGYIPISHPQVTIATTNQRGMYLCYMCEANANNESTPLISNS